MSDFSPNFNFFGEEFLENRNSNIQFGPVELDNTNKKLHKFGVVSRKLFEDQPHQNPSNKLNNVFQVKKRKIQEEMQDEASVPDTLFPDLPIESFSQLCKAALKKPSFNSVIVPVMSKKKISTKAFCGNVNKTYKSSYTGVPKENTTSKSLNVVYPDINTRHKGSYTVSPDIIKKCKGSNAVVPEINKTCKIPCTVVPYANETYKSSYKVPDIKIEESSPFKTPLKLKSYDVKDEKENYLQELLLAWCSQNKIYDELDQQLLKQNIENKKQPVFCFTITLDVQNLIDDSVLLGNLVINSPVLFCKLLKRVCFSLLYAESLLLKLQSIHQLIITPTFINIPAADEHEIMRSSDFQNHKLTSGRLFRLRTLVIGISSSVSYTLSTKYKCSNCSCSDFVLTASLDSVESDLIRSDLCCQICGLLMEEDFSQRISSEKLYCFGVPVSSTKCLQLNTFGRSQSIKVVVRDELSKKIKIGEYYWFIGFFKYDVRPGFMQNQCIQVTFEALTIEDACSRVKFKYMPSDAISLLYNDRKCSPWSFVLSLAFCFAESIAPSGLYHLLKLCLMFSLVMEGDSSYLNLDEDKGKVNHNLLHILCQDQDLLMCQRLMMYGCSFSENPVVHKLPMNLFGSVTEEGSSFFVDGGSLVLASTDICCILNHAALKKKQQEKLSKVLEYKCASINIPRKQQHDGQQCQLILPINCTIWSCSEKDSSHCSTSIPFSSQFNLVLNQSKEFKSSNILACYVLDSVSKKTASSMFSSAQLKEFVSQCRHQSVEMTHASFKLMKAFYFTRRRSGLPHVTQLLFNTILSLSAAHSKLMLHPKVEIDDAVAAIYIVEQLDTLMHGESLSGIRPVIHFPKEEMFKRIGPENDALMYQFKSFVVHQCSIHYPELRKEVLTQT
ncbi:minichromosome maintenance domain-containing protein 2 isoform X3 [Hydra vulgaris]|uniref:Minichromosome maintenance domain-containing protein 2 isoform X3 n=1 Tax=Hydra vulgaris TaxID=6087 RepID=A0ABM4BL42_HYDVU